VYINRLGDVNLGVLRELVEKAFEQMRNNQNSASDPDVK
jgi:hypothetical protein